MILMGLFLNLALAKNVLVIGDSHMAGPFGPRLHSLVANEKHQVVTLGHASSAAFHWVDQKQFSLSGGVFNQAQILDQTLLNPSPTHWSKKVLVPKFDLLLEDMLYHEAWKSKIKTPIKPDMIIVELGANDTKIIADENGNINPSGYKQRKQAIEHIVAKIKEIKAECVWVAPPDGLKKNPKQVKRLYELLNETVANDCRMFDSREYKATVCSDGVHFSCGSDMNVARAWATEVFEFTGL